MDNMVEQDIPICLVPQEKHFDSFHNLLKEFKEFEKRRNPIKLPDEMMKNVYTGFEKIKMADSSDYLLLPSRFEYGILYRGQNSYYEKCLPTIYRGNPTDIQILVDLIRIEEFRILLNKLPITNFFRKNLFHVDYEGLAQHYGLRTRVLDFTSDPEIAFFFAMCDFRNGKYYPKNENKEYIGYIYAISTLAEMQDARKNNLFSGRVQSIGLQPFKRPGLQKGYSHILDENGLQYGYLYSFSYTMQDSKDIYNRFDRGNALWVEDGINECTAMILNSRSFSYQALSQAVKKHKPNISIRKIQKLLLKNDYQIVNPKKLEWYFYFNKLNTINEQEIIDQVGQRCYIEGNVKRDCLDVKKLFYILTLAILQNPVMSPPGYDSGFSIIGNSLKPGLSISNNHKYLIPSSDGKIDFKGVENDV